MYLSFSGTNIPLCSFVSLNKTSLLSSSVFLSKPASNWRKAKKRRKGARQNLVYSTLKATFNNKKKLKHKLYLQTVITIEVTSKREVLYVNI